jgi:ferredoxin-NADP reductase
LDGPSDKKKSAQLRHDLEKRKTRRKKKKAKKKFFLIKANPFKRDTKQDLERTLPKRRTANYERSKEKKIKKRNKKKRMTNKEERKKASMNICSNQTRPRLPNKKQNVALQFLTFF